jgi:uncharacterized membrane protein YjjB (DUF3815 family)
MQLPPETAAYLYRLYKDRYTLFAVLTAGLLIIPPTGIVLWLFFETGWRALVVAAIFGVIGWLVYLALSREYTEP